MKAIIEFVLHIWRELSGYYDRPVPYVIVKHPDWDESEGEK